MIWTIVNRPCARMVLVSHPCFDGVGQVWLRRKEMKKGSPLIPVGPVTLPLIGGNGGSMVLDPKPTIKGEVPDFDEADNPTRYCG